jgi:TetR/AcrR family tetracycline transcriptional repressor
VKLTKERIIDAGMVTFAEHGYAGLSMRQVAERLDVHAGSLYYHVRNKEALLALLADRVAAQAFEAGEKALAVLGSEAGWVARVEAQANALRETLREHEGGPLLLAGSPSMLSPGSLALMERLLTTLRDGGVPDSERSIVADLLLSYITGFVLQEQAEPQTTLPADADLASLAASFPLTFSVAQSHTSDEMFARSIRRLCDQMEGGRVEGGRVEGGRVEGGSAEGGRVEGGSEERGREEGGRVEGRREEGGWGEAGLGRVSGPASRRRSG